MNRAEILDKLAFILHETQLNDAALLDLNQAVNLCPDAPDAPDVLAGRLSHFIDLNQLELARFDLTQLELLTQVSLPQGLNKKYINNIVNKAKLKLNNFNQVTTTDSPSLMVQQASPNNLHNNQDKGGVGFFITNSALDTQTKKKTKIESLDELNPNSELSYGNNLG